MGLRRHISKRIFLGANSHTHSNPWSVADSYSSAFKCFGA